MSSKSRAAFNVSCGMPVNATMNVSMAMLLCDFVTTIADSEEMMDLLRQNEKFQDGVPQELFALATNCRKQAKTAIEFEQNRRTRQIDAAA